MTMTLVQELSTTYYLPDKYPLDHVMSNKEPGSYGSSEYKAWQNMLSRCRNPNNASYERYGARGIGVEPRWVESFQAFFADMGPKPGPEYTLERNDVNGNYGPGNCCWATMEEQQNNKRNNVRVDFEGESLTVAQLVRKAGIKNPVTVHNRLKAGRSMDEVTSKFRLDEKPIEFNGEKLSVSDWADRLGIPAGTIRQRRNRGMSVEDTLKPVRPYSKKDR